MTPLEKSGEREHQNPKTKATLSAFHSFSPSIIIR